MPKLKNKDVDTLIKLYEIYDRHRDSLLWFLHELDAQSYEEYKQKYPGTSQARVHFTSVCGFFELSGALLNSGMLDQNLYFEALNTTPFWERAKPIVGGMRKERPHIYENFELLNKKRVNWAKKRKAKLS